MQSLALCEEKRELVWGCVLCSFKSQTHTFRMDTWLDCISCGSKIQAALIWHRHNDLIFKLFPFLSNQLKIITCFLASLALQYHTQTCADNANAAIPPMAIYQPVLENSCESHIIDYIIFKSRLMKRTCLVYNLSRLDFSGMTSEAFEDVWAWMSLLC